MSQKTDQTEIYESEWLKCLTDIQAVDEIPPGARNAVEWAKRWKVGERTAYVWLRKMREANAVKCFRKGMGKYWLIIGSPPKRGSVPKQ